jgi:hypothetical protein
VKVKASKSLLRSLNKIYWRETRRVLLKVRQPVMDQVEVSDPETLRLMIPSLLQTQPMVDHLVKIWGKVGGLAAYNVDKTITEGKKAVKRTLSEHEANMRAYAYQRSLLKARKILDTEAEAINRVITDVVDRAVVEGLSVPNTRRLMQDSLESELTTIENWQAERIARTEVGGAYNTGSFESARDSGYEMKKEWLTSGLPNVRETHLAYEALGAVEMDYEYASGLQFPQDENGEAEEIINCRCTVIYDVLD